MIVLSSPFRLFLTLALIIDNEAFTNPFHFHSGSTHSLCSETQHSAFKRNRLTHSATKKDSNDSCLDTNLEYQEETTLDGSKGIGFYIHIPYCRRRCRYCDFAIVPVGKDSLKENERFLDMDEKYKTALLKEVQLLAASLKTKRNLKSIYFGGGTPSLAPISTIRAIMDSIFNSGKFDLDDNAEITMEMDPGTFDLKHAEELRQIGFNRISLGVQSFDDRILENIGRVHRLQDIKDAVNIIKMVFGEEANYSIDLISGLPDLTCAKWAETLDMALSLTPPPAHLSLYDMQIEMNTVFGEWYTEQIIDDDEDESEDRSAKVGRENTLNLPSIQNINKNILPLPTPDDCAFMYKYASGYLSAKGFEHYEISSYARVVAKSEEFNEKANSKRSIHNQIYWDTEGDWCGKFFV